MLDLTQFLIFELGSTCNLSRFHAKCPTRSPARWSSLDTTRPLDDGTIVAAAVQAYRELGFAGWVGWHYYNEPTLEGPRMLDLMARISEQVPAQFILWTNGTRLEWIIENYSRFIQVVITQYGNDPTGSQLDDRLKLPCSRDSDRPCCRPFTEFILDAYGNHHPCCADWAGNASLGNVFTDGFATLVGKFRKFQEQTCGKTMAADAPAWCRRCDSGFRGVGISGDIPLIRDAAARWREAR